MSSDATDNTMRAEFERWWVAPGEQFHDEEDIAWQAWQAARADTARQVAEAVAAEREAMDRLLQVAGLGLPIRGNVYVALAYVRACLAARSKPTPPTA